MVKTCNDPQDQETCTIIAVGMAVKLPIMMPGMDPAQFEQDGGTTFNADEPTATQEEKQQADKKNAERAKKQAEASQQQQRGSEGNGGTSVGVPESQPKNKTETSSSGGPYSHLDDDDTVEPRKDFSAKQKANIIEENKKKNGGVVKSDQSGTVLTKPQKSKKGVTPSQNEWQVDHIKPRDKGGTNSYSNAQVLSRQENRQKWNK
jgi:hypothetical protein